MNIAELRYALSRLPPEFDSTQVPPSLLAGSKGIFENALAIGKDEISIREVASGKPVMIIRCEDGTSAPKDMLYD
jgi:hypothetical protein